MEGRVFEMFSKNLKFFKIRKMPKIVPKIVQLCFEHVLGVLFEKNFCPVFHGGSSLRNVFKKSKNFHNSKNAQNCSQTVETCFEHVLGYFFCKLFLPSVPWRVESSKCFQKIEKFSKVQKCPKSFPKVSNYVLNMFWGYFFRKFFFAQSSVPGRVFEMFLINKKNFKIPKMPKIVPKSVQLCFEHVLGVLFSKIFFCPVFHGVFEMFLKSFQKSKNAQNCSQNVQTCFEHVSGVTFSKTFFAQCFMEGRVCEMSSKNLKFFKIPKMPKIVPKIVQLCFEHVLGALFEKKFCPVFHGGSSLRNVFKKSKIFQNSKNAQNRSQNCPIVFWTCFGGTFWKKFLPSVPWRVESSKCFQKIEKFSKVQKCPKSFPKVSNYVLNMFWGYFFRKFFFAQSSVPGRVFEMFLINKKNFKIPKMPKIVPKSVQLCFEHVLGVLFSKIFFAQCSMEFSKCF